MFLTCPFSKKGQTVLVKAFEDYKGDYNPTGVEGTLFQVIDFGKGIASHEVQFVFEQFFRAKEVENITGTGLSLFIAQKLAQFHKGQLFAASALDKGSTFSFFLPSIRRKSLYYVNTSEVGLKD